MYEWIFRHLPGPTWLRVIEVLIVVTVIVAVLFQWVFPWAQEYFHLSDSRV